MEVLIPVHEVVLVHMIEGRYNLKDDLSCCFFAEVLVFDEDLEKLLSFAVLSYYEDVSGTLEDFIYFDDVWMILSYDFSTSVLRMASYISIKLLIPPL